MSFHSVADFPRPVHPKSRSGALTCLAGFLLAAAAAIPAANAYGPRGFDTVVIDAGHGGIDRGGGPGQRIPEKPYTLDTAQRLERALRSRGFRTVMTRNGDYFVTLRDRVAIGASQRGNAIFVSIHFNSAPREGAHGYETYYYRSDSFGLASRLHHAMLGTLNTEDRHVRRRAFYVLRNPRVPAVLCEGGFLTNYQEANTVMNSSYRERLAENLAAAITEQSRYGDPGELGYQPAVTTERLVYSSSRGSRGGGGGRHGGRHSASRRHHSGGRRSSGSRHHTSGSSRHHSSESSRHHRRHSR